MGNLLLLWANWGTIYLTHTKSCASVVGMSKTNPVDPQPSTFDFFKAIPNEDAARKHLTDARWPNGVTCHHCGHDAVWTIRGGRLFTCKACRKQFTVRTGTVMEDSALP